MERLLERNGPHQQFRSFILDTFGREQLQGNKFFLSAMFMYLTDFKIRQLTQTERTSPSPCMLVSLLLAYSSPLFFSPFSRFWLHPTLAQ